MHSRIRAAFVLCIPEYAARVAGIVGIWMRARTSQHGICADRYGMAVSSLASSRGFEAMSELGRLGGLPVLNERELPLGAFDDGSPLRTGLDV